MSEQLLTIGIDIGGTNLRAAVVDDNGQVLDVEQLPTPPSSEALEMAVVAVVLSLIHISEPTRHFKRSRMPSCA